MRWSRATLLLAMSCFGIVTPALPCRAEEPKKIDFAHDIVPILKTRCAECHTNGKHKGSLSMDTRGTLLRAKVVVPGKSGASELLKRIQSRDPDERMPPKGERLSERQVAQMRAWIDQGLSWEEGFTFAAGSYVPPLKPRRPPLPPIREGRDHPIDRILDAYYADRQQTVPAPLDDITFARRLYLDVIGQLPAPEELAAFLKDTASDKRARLIRRLLDDRRAFAEHWLTFWNDLLRNDYQGTGYIDGGRKQITGWLYRSLLDNKPYDQFVRELISPTPESEGFIKGIKWRGRVNASQVPALQFSQNVSQVFFGINMKCASCHDSFIDTWKLDDAYSLAAVIADQPLEIHRCDKPLGRKANPRFLWPELGGIDATQPRAKRLEQLARLVTHPANGRLQRTIANRIWQRLFGRGIVHPVDVMANKPWSEDLLDYLGAYLGDHGYDLKQLIEHIVRSRAYQSRAVVQKEEMPAENYVFRGPELKRLTAEQYLDAVWQITRTAPAKAAAPITPPPFPSSTPVDRQYVRAALVNADALMRSLGRPNREQVVTTRPDQLTTLQALDLSNGRILSETLTRGAVNLLKDNPKATGEQLIERIYQRALCRRPNAAELATAREILGASVTPESLADLLWVVFMLPEFQMIR
ncbi:MAG TPA: PSD1 and planctomycete cytochrome C domain-containing protein [Gemmataceae bacterium]|nr:PSD1 and planctomycete cytochrome C domain-containing protein [Gemmataceae bacterium]